MNIATFRTVKKAYADWRKDKELSEEKKKSIKKYIEIKKENKEILDHQWTDKDQNRLDNSIFFAEKMGIDV